MARKTGGLTNLGQFCVPHRPYLLTRGALAMQAFAVAVAVAVGLTAMVAVALTQGRAVPAELLDDSAKALRC